MKSKSKHEDPAPSADEVTTTERSDPVNIEEAIAVEAYHLWEAAGCPEGRDEEFWLVAASKLREGITPKN